MNPRIKQLLENYPDLEYCRSDIDAAYEIMLRSYRCQGRMLLCGNGGSAADAEHWAGELLKGFCRPRKLNEEQRKGLDPVIADKLQNALPAIPLTGFYSLSTAFGNDIDPELTFAQLVWGLGQPGDVLVALSTSGNSANVLHAAGVAPAKGMKVIGMTGCDGGKLAGLCDICIRTPSSETARVQEYHLPIYHVFSLMLEDEFFS
jgi:D-sedoheptulose 7-phosphate isomerase